MDVEAYAHCLKPYCVVARSQDHLVLIDIDMLSGCDCGGREALQCNGVVSQWEEFRTFV